MLCSSHWYVLPVGEGIACHSGLFASKSSYNDRYTSGFNADGNKLREAYLGGWAAD